MNTLPRCASQLFGLWLIHDPWFAQALAAYRNGDLKPRQQDSELDPEDEGFIFERGPNGMIIVKIMGQITKRRSSFGGTSSLDVRRVLRDAQGDPTVSGALLFIDSPGGTAAGTFELAQEVQRFAAVKPIRAHIEDLGASAAYWVAAQTQKITINQMGEAGSIGTVAVLIDSSKAAEMEGLKIHVISTGALKGAGAPGTEVTEEMLKVFQEQVDDINRFFLEGIERGRGLSGAQLAQVATGRVWIAAKAMALGLVDEIMSFEDAVDQFAGEIEPTQSSGSSLAQRIEMMSIEVECE